MKITSIDIQKNSSRVNLFVDGKFYMGVPVDAILEFKLKKGMELDQNTMDRLRRFDEHQRTKFSAYKYLSYRQRSVNEMKKYLLSKGYGPAIISDVVSHLMELGYLNDFDFAKSFVDDKSRLNYLGEYRLKYELRKKGIEDSIITDVLSEIEPDIEELTELIRKKYSKILSEDMAAAYRKIGGFLQRKGYGYDVVKRVLEGLRLEEE